MKNSSIIKYLINLIFPQKCAACGKITDIDKALCEECLCKWKSEKKRHCSKCGGNITSCHCFPELIRESGIPIIWSNFYDKNTPQFVSNKVIYKFKRKYDFALIDFLASEISLEINRYFNIHGFDLSKWCVTYPPRKPESIEKYGYDHAKALAERVSIKLKIPFISAFIHSNDSSEQKKLNLAQRTKNAERAYSLRDGIDFKDKYVILIDDIITTGSTMKVCADLLKAAGARYVVIAASEKTAESNEKNF